MFVCMMVACASDRHRLDSNNDFFWLVGVSLPRLLHRSSPLHSVSYTQSHSATLNAILIFSFFLGESFFYFGKLYDLSVDKHQ